MATAAAAVAGFNEIDLAFARYKNNAGGKRLLSYTASAVVKTLLRPKETGLPRPSQFLNAPIALTNVQCGIS